MNVSADSSRPAQSSAAQQSGGAAQVQESSEVHATLSMLSTTRAIADTPAATTLAPRRRDTAGWALDPLLVIYWMCACSIYRRS